MPHEQINKIIEYTLKPQLKKECDRLGIPARFIKGIYAIHPKAFDYSSMCEVVKHNDQNQGVRIRIDCSITTSGPALRDFWHELRHAQDYYRCREPSELKAILYSWRRWFQYLLQENIHK